MCISILETKICEGLAEVESEMNRLIEADKQKYPAMVQIGVTIFGSTLNSCRFGVVYEKLT